MKNLLQRFLLLILLFTGYTATAQTTSNDCNPEFTWQANTALDYHFYPVSVNDSLHTRHVWSFGDGTGQYPITAPIHHFPGPGTYIVTHIIYRTLSTGAVCTQTITHTIIIAQTNACTLLASFYITRDSSNSGPLNTIVIHNTSTGFAPGDSIRWTFGDGSASNAVNPVHTYTTPGIYNICVRIIKRNPNGVLTNCVSESCMSVTIYTPVAVCQLNPAFVFTRDSTATPAHVFHFQNTTAGALTTDSTIWSFGDGTSSTNHDPIHTYTQPGTYNVCLTIIRRTAAGVPACTGQVCHSITITAPTPTPPPINECLQFSRFVWERSTSDSMAFNFHPELVRTNVQYTWTFGDGTGFIGTNASHHYTNPGTYTVCLTAYRSATCASTTCRTVVVSAPVNCSAVTAQITLNRDPALQNRVFLAALSNHAIIDQTWKIYRVSAGIQLISTIHAMNPTYLFQDTGSYRVCLRGVTAEGCVVEQCRDIQITAVNVALCNLSLYPNPVHNELHVMEAMPQTMPVLIEIYNTLNVRVYQQVFQGYSGNNTFTINTTALPVGSYMLRVSFGTVVCYQQFQKL